MAHFVNVVFGLVTDHSDHELIQPVASPLHTVNRAFCGVNGADREDGAVTGRAKGSQAFRLVDGPDTWLERPREEVSEVGI